MTKEKPGNSENSGKKLQEILAIIASTLSFKSEKEAPTIVLKSGDKNPRGMKRI